MKSKLGAKITVAAAMFALAAVSSCRDNFDIEEIKDFDDSLSINGQVALPLIGTTIRFSQLKKEAIGSDVDFDTSDANLVHINFDKTFYPSHLVFPDYVEGEENLPISEGIPLNVQTNRQGMFSDDMIGGIKVKDPMIVLTLNNKLGFDAILGVDKISFYDDFDNEIYSIQNSSIGTTVENGKESSIIVKNEDEGDAFGCKGYVYIDNVNYVDTTLSDILFNKPAYYKLFLTITPQNVSDVSQINVEDIDIHFFLDMPLEIQTNKEGFTLKDSTDFEFDKEIFDNVDELEIKGRAKNKFEIDFLFSAWFVNSKTGQKIKPLIEDWSVAGNQSNYEYKVSTLKREDIILLEKAADMIVFEIGFSKYDETPNSDNYGKIKVSDFVDLKVSLRAAASYSIETDDNQ